MEIDSRAEAIRLPAGSRRIVGPALSGRRLSPCDKHAATASRPSAATNCSMLDGKRRSGAYAAIRTHPTNEFVFAVVGSMTDAKRRGGAGDTNIAGRSTMRRCWRHADRFWRNITRGVRIRQRRRATRRRSTRSFPGSRTTRWCISRSRTASSSTPAPHGARAMSARARWNCSCRSSTTSRPRTILRIVFAQQYEKQGDWPQWFMLEPYSAMQDRKRMATSSSGR